VHTSPFRALRGDPYAVKKEPAGMFSVSTQIRRPSKYLEKAKWGVRVELI